jgi:23S rRNA pseudouridine1911/1915/1917 synthase
MPDPIRNTDILPENIPIDVVYEDDYVILVNKKAGMVVHPAYANFTGTLVNALRYHFGDLPAGLNPEFRAGLVHRIDKDTSGLLVVAKTDDALNKLARQFFHHSIHRKYVALVWGNVENDEGTIDKNLKRHPKDRRLITTTEDEDGKRAITHYKVVERFGYATLLEFRLETGTNTSNQGSHKIYWSSYFCRYYLWRRWCCLWPFIFKVSAVCYKLL